MHWFGYKVDTTGLENLPTKLILIGSHTSIYDFIIGTLFYYGYLHDRYDSYVLMKDQFEAYCKPFLRYFDKRFKLISIDSSSKKKGVTEQVCNSLKDKNNYLLFIAPEGTRKSTDKLRSGYWYISRNLDINIVYIGIDFLEKNTEIIKLKKPEDADTFSFDIETHQGTKTISIETPVIEDGNAIKAELSSFVHAIINNETPVVSEIDGFLAMEVAHQILEKISKSSPTLKDSTEANEPMPLED